MKRTQSNRNMTTKPGWRMHSTPQNPGNLYSYWQDQLRGESAQPFLAFCQQFGEDFQRALLIALAATGWLPYEWNPIFICILHGLSPYADLGKLYLCGQLQDPYQYFLKKLTTERVWFTYFPPTCPEWLFAYQYTQQQYLQDLSQVWDNIRDDYYKPWTITRIGTDSPAVARLKLLGREARQEIDHVARQNNRYSDILPF